MLFIGDDVPASEEWFKEWWSLQVKRANDDNMTLMVVDRTYEYGLQSLMQKLKDIEQIEWDGDGINEKDRVRFTTQHKIRAAISKKENMLDSWGDSMEVEQKLLSSIFKGEHYFAICSKTQFESTDFDTSALNTAILRNGGQIIPTWIKKESLGKFEKKCYAITQNGERSYCSQYDTLLRNLKVAGILMVPVTPTWINDCLKMNAMFNPAHSCILFQPHPWKVRSLPRSTSGSQDGFTVSVTGFLDASRYGIIDVLEQIGATYTDNLRRTNTHLICKEAQGMKYSKAVEWGIHVVLVEFLYHVMQHGYEDGLEAKFSL